MKKGFRFLACEPELPDVNGIPKEFLDTVRHSILLALKEMGELTDQQYFLAEEVLEKQYGNKKAQIND